MKIRFKKLSPEAKMPTRATDGSCGLDLYATADKMLFPGDRVVIPIGIAVEIPYGYYGQIGGRSGKFIKEGLLCATGYIDSDYRDGIGVMCVNASQYPIQIFKGERCGQMVVLQHPHIELEEVEELSEGGHGSGFGHSGKF